MKIYHNLKRLRELTRCNLSIMKQYTSLKNTNTFIITSLKRVVLYFCLLHHFLPSFFFLFAASLWYTFTNNLSTCTLSKLILFLIFILHFCFLVIFKINYFYFAVEENGNIRTFKGLHYFYQYSFTWI